MKVDKVGEGVQTLPVSIQGKPAFVSFNDSLFWLNRCGASKSKSKDPLDAYVCVPQALILFSSFIPDSDGGSLLLRLLTPPSTTSRSLFLPFTQVKSRAQEVVEKQKEVESDASLSPQDRLHAQLQGPCNNLRLINIEARISDVALVEEAKGWAQKLMDQAYGDVRPYRKLKVLINPVGGPGKSLQLFASRIRPVLEAAGCVMDLTVTKYVNHGLEIARSMSLKDGFDAIVCVSGDGMLHEVLNGLAQRKDAIEALKIPVAPIPTGSGNAVALNLLGVEQGFNLALACLNLIKGKSMPLDVCSITQPADIHDVPTSATSKRLSSAPPQSPSALSSDSTTSTSAPLPYTVYYSFLSQAIGLMADVDLGTEDMRALGDTRFILGYIGGVLTNRECEVDIYVKIGDHGSKNKREMREGVLSAKKAGRKEEALHGGKQVEEGEEEYVASASLRNGPVTDPLPEGEDTPELDVRDPSWYNSIVDKLVEKQEGPIDPSKWYRVPLAISTLYAGKAPYVARDLLQFPYSYPGDQCVEVAIQMQEGGRGAKLRAITVSESGAVIYDAAVVYLKVEAYRVVPRYKEGDRRLKKGGLISIDGEHRPYRSFQVEVNKTVCLRVLSIYGRWCVPDVTPPKVADTSTTTARPIATPS
ncbi:hypothetical protein CBS101457_005840 [Exobasidium rhododendri]|nr:hypothetical protein CBS101457_005840 [Exobasidium rhododendri]